MIILRNVFVYATIVLVSLSLSFGWAGYYCLNSGEGDLAGGLWFTFALPAFGLAFTTLLCAFTIRSAE